MKMTNQAMYNSIDALYGINETGKLGYACARNLRKLLGEVEDYVNVRNKLIAKYGTPNDEGDTTVRGENIQPFLDELDEYANIEHDVDVFQIDEDTFCSGSLTMQQMFALDWMVKESNA